MSNALKESAVIAPFPFATLEAFTREEARAERALKMLTTHLVNVDAIAAALSELTQEPVQILLRRTRKFTRPRGADDFVGVALAPRDAAPQAGIARAMLIEVESAFAHAVARKLLKRPPARVYDPARPPSVELVGAFAALTQAVARRAHASAPVAIVAAGPGTSLFSDLLRASVAQEAFTLSLTVVFGNDAYEARVSVARDAIHFAREIPWNHEILESLDQTPLTLQIILATSAVRAREVMALMPGDAFMPGGAIALGADGSITGSVLLCAPRSEIALRAHAEHEAKLTFDGEIVSLSWSGAWAEASMKEDTGKTEIAVADAPVIVRVEIGAAELTAREWANLKKGDVIALEKKLGDAVSLRVSGVEVAKGELIQIDGEVGVRILSRTV